MIFNFFKMPALLQEWLITFGWAITGAISMGIALGIGLKIYDWLTPIDEWHEIKKGNMAMAVIIAAVVIALGLVIGLTIN